MKLLFILISALALQTSVVVAQTDSVYLWPNAVPGEIKTKAEPIPVTLEDGSIRVVEVTDPFLAVFEPTASMKNGKAVIVCPGGGYIRLAIHKEGYTTANWLADLGYTVFVLHYRVPNKRNGALHDLQRGLRLIRHDAKKYEIDAAKVGAIGFSAGGDLVVRAEMLNTFQGYPEQDAADKLPATPDRMIVIYPAYLDGGPNKSLTPGLSASEQTADTFIFQTMDDDYGLSAFALATALQKAKANVELHMLPAGGHGYGMSPGNKAAETWPILLAWWLKEHL